MSTKSSGLISQLGSFVNKIQKTCQEMRTKIEKTATAQARIVSLMEEMKAKQALMEYVIVSL